MRNNRIRNVVVHIADNADIHALGDKVSIFHADMIERKLRQSSLSTEQKIAVINKIIDALKSGEINLVSLNKCLCNRHTVYGLVLLLFCSQLRKVKGFTPIISASSSCVSLYFLRYALIFSAKSSKSRKGKVNSAVSSFLSAPGNMIVSLCVVAQNRHIWQ